MKKVVVIEGDDAAPEAMQPTVKILKQFELPIEWIHPSMDDAGNPKQLSPEIKNAIDTSDTTLFGSTSGGQSRWAIYYLRWGKQTYANFRPCKYMPGIQSCLKDPNGIDLVIVRENLEDMYVGCEGDLQTLAPLELTSRTSRGLVADLAPGKFAIKAITEAGCKRVINAAFNLARERKQAGKPGKLCCATKHNMLPQSDGLFREIGFELAKEHADIEFESLIVDDFAHRLIAHPQRFDVVVTPNLYGDILSDAASGLLGGLGVASSGCYGDDYAYFESVHGTAPDIAGQNCINPTATMLSACMMLRYLEFTEAADQFEQAIWQVYAEGSQLTKDQGGRASTTEFSQAVESKLFN